MERFRLADLYEEFRDCDENVMVDDGVIYDALQEARFDAENGDTLAKRLVMQLSLEQPISEMRANVLALLEPVYSEYKRDVARFSNIEKELYKRACAVFAERGFEQKEKGSFLKSDKKALMGIRYGLDVKALEAGSFIVGPRMSATRALLHRGKVRFRKYGSSFRLRPERIPAEEFDIFAASMSGFSEDVKDRFILSPTYSVRLDENGALTAGEESEYTRAAGSKEELWEGVLLCAGAACDTAEGKKPPKEYLELADELQGEGLKKYGRNKRIRRVIACFAAGLAFGILLTLAFILMARIEGEPLGSLAWKIFAFSSIGFALALLPFMLIANYREKNMMLK